MPETHRPEESSREDAPIAPASADKSEPHRILKFKVDSAAAARMARIRLFVLGTTTVLLLLAFVLVLSYRPSPRIAYQTTMSSMRASQPESVVASRRAAEAGPVSQAASFGPMDTVFSVLAYVDSAGARAADRWVRAEALVPQGRLDTTNAADAAALLRKAATLADSARADIAGARNRADAIRAISRAAEAGLGYRLSVVYASGMKYLQTIGQDADDRYLYYRTLEEAFVLLAQADEAGFETKQNVANSYRRRSDDRQRAVRQQAGQLSEAARGLSATAH